MAQATSQANTDSLLKARLVYDGGALVYVPEQMGTPREDQLQGTPAEQLSELAGRVCYDSLGKGRPSFSQRCELCGGHGYYKGPRLGDEPCPDCKGHGRIEGYHDHILAVNHGSVYEHFNFTVEINFESTAIGENRKMLVAWQCMNRPGVLVLPVQNPAGLRITVNLRAVLEWQNWTREFYGSADDQFGLDRQLAYMLADHANILAPNVVKLPADRYEIDMWPELGGASRTNPISNHERWASLFLSGSRGFSHEQVRHGDFTAISQRSTRYVDESESGWVEHPLFTEYRESVQLKGELCLLHEEAGGVSIESRDLYASVVETLEPWLISRGVDKLTARKQARGVARGYLGNALYTEMIFSASVAQWRRMLHQRCSDAADAEIRLVYNHVLGELKRSRYGDRFADMQLRPAKDGIGMVLDL